MISNGEENESAVRLCKERLLLLGKVDLTDELAVNVIGVGSIVRGSSGVLDSLGSVELLALGQERGLGEVIFGVGEVDLASVLLGRGGVDVDAGEASGDLLGGGLEVVLSDGRHGRKSGWGDAMRLGTTEGCR